MLRNIDNMCPTLGHLPTSYLASLTFEEQLLNIGEKTDEIINFINNILQEKMDDYINKTFNDMIINTMYISDTETLVLYLDKRNEV